MTKPRSPTTTGRIESFRKSLRRKLLYDARAFADQAATRASIEARVHAYTHNHLCQAQDRAAPATACRPGPPGNHIRLPARPPSTEPPPAELGLLPVQLPAESPSPRTPVADEEIRAVEWETTILPIGRVFLVNNRQVKFTRALGGKHVTVWPTARAPTSCSTVSPSAPVRPASPRTTCTSCRSEGPELPDRSPARRRPKPPAPSRPSRWIGSSTATAASNSADSACCRPLTSLCKITWDLAAPPRAVPLRGTHNHCQRPGQPPNQRDRQHGLLLRRPAVLQ
ncbi:integrase core domain-containing protein [Embleya sp. NBC_00896]|uniref:integrase core domain-containing protein n=1 Tax=Embleya sp. NBC_00896 TaxID=2975961 RepID=UPI0038640AF3